MKPVSCVIEQVIQHLKKTQQVGIGKDYLLRVPHRTVFLPSDAALGSVTYVQDVSFDVAYSILSSCLPCEAAATETSNRTLPGREVACFAVFHRETMETGVQSPFRKLHYPFITPAS